MSREMKDSGIEWIGEIPKEWEIGRIGQLYTERKEKVSDKDYAPLSVTMKGIVPQLSTAAKTDAHDDRKLVLKGDFAINSRSDRRGSCGISKYDGSVSLINIILSPKKKMNPVYYEWLFHSTMFSDEFYKWGHGIVDDLWTTNWQDMKKISVPMPSYKEQQAIASFLDSQCAHIDSVIEKTRAAIEEYKKLKQAVITQAVTKGIRLNREMKDSQTGYIGEIPIDWKVIRIRYLGTCQNGISKGGEFFGSGFPFVSYSDVYKNIELPLHVDKLVESTEEEQERYSVKEGDIFFTRTSETVEEVGFSSVCRNTIENATFAGFLIRVRPYTQKVLSGFSKYYFRSDIHREYFVKEMNLVTRASLGQELLKSMPVLIPSISEQSEIVAYLDEKTAAIDSLIQKKEQLITELEAYKKSLIYEYVTGKKEVKADITVEYSPEFKKALLMCRILELTQCKGRIHLQKTFFAIDTLLNLFSTQYYRFEHGPYDLDIESYEKIIEENGWLNICVGKSIRYNKTNTFSDYFREYEKVFGDRDDIIQRICKVFNVPRTTKAEKIATLLAVWNDFLINGIEPTDDMIIDDVITNWTPNKANVSRETWGEFISKIRENNIVPKGYGKHTKRMEELVNGKKL